MQRDDLLVWIDTETTGLDFQKDVLLEIACVITTKDLEVVAVFDPKVLHCEAKRLAQMGEWAQKQHRSSQLWEECVSSVLSIAEAEKELCEFILQYCVAQSSPWCGNSVAFDRSMLEKQMPQVCELLHYRLIDVSTIKELVRRWYGEALLYPKKGTHRALDDIYESIAELRWYKEKVFLRS